MTTHHWTAAIKYCPNNASISCTSNALGVSETINTIYIFVLLACGQIYRVWQWFSVTHGWRSRMVQSGRQSYKRCSLQITLETDNLFVILTTTFIITWTPTFGRPIVKRFSVYTLYLNFSNFKHFIYSRKISLLLEWTSESTIYR